MNGRELTAEDVVFNYHRVTGMGSGFSKPEELNSQLPTLEYESISASDQYTVVVKLENPRLDAFRVLVEDNVGFIAPPEVIEQHGDHSDWRNLVGTGPFELTDWVDGSSLTWTRNASYWGTDEKYPQNQLPYIDTLRLLVMPDEASRLAAPAFGEGGLHRSQCRLVDQDPRIIVSEASLSFLGFGLPHDVPSWGGMLSREGRQHMEIAPRLALWPGLCLTIVVYSVNMFGDALRDLLDPRLRGSV